MIQPIIFENHGALPFVPAFPGGYQGPVLAGSQAFSCMGDFGSIVVQDIEGDHFNIRYIILRLFQKMVLHRKEEEKLRVQFVLQESLRYKRNGQVIAVAAGEYNLVWAPGKKTQFHFRPDREYRLLHLYYEPVLLREVYPAFPSRKTIPHENQVKIIKAQLRRSIEQMLNTSFKIYKDQSYYENLVRMVMSHLLYLKDKQHFFKDLSLDEIARINKLEQFILEDLTAHYTIKELARKARMGQVRLKEAFKKVTGMGLYEKLKDARLQKARQLLLETDLLVKEIYLEVGYEGITSFIGAFRKCFGMSPSQYRKRNIPNG
ncbi:MAG: helix-turn-helix domain-containing protein [Flavisolibacter sp.]